MAIRRNVATLCATAAAIVFALPGLRFSYLFDDYNFLAGPPGHRLGSLAPDPGSLLYRPLSRDVYFGLLNLLAPGSALLGHFLNLTLLAFIVILGASLATQVAGRRAGIVAAILLSGFAPWPVLVAWVSGCQDLLAIFLVLLALHLEYRGRGVAALAAFAAALLSKETAVFAAPAFIAVRWLDSRSPASTRWGALRIALLCLGWALVHPGIRRLASLGGAAPPGGYIGFDNPMGWQYLSQDLPVMLNLPLTGHPTPWPSVLAWTLILGGAPLGVTLWCLRTDRMEKGALGRGVGPGRKRQVLVFGALLAGLPLALTSLLVQHWAPYYTCFAAAGFAVGAAPWMAGLRPRVLIPLLALYVVCGFWSRGIQLEPGLPTELGLAPAGRALVQLERNFKRVAPTLPPRAVVYVTTLATGPQSVYIHIHGFQVLRIWYRDPAIEALRPELRVVTSSPECLFGIGPTLNVLEIDLRTLRARSSDGSVDPISYRKTVTSYAIGLAETDDLDRSVRLLSSLSPPGTWDHVTDLRLAAALLISRGERQTALELVRGLPQLPVQVAIGDVGLLLTVPTRRVYLEEPALEAFGLSAKDSGILRVLLRGLLQLGYDDAARRIAVRLLTLVPGDPEASAALQRVRGGNAAGGTRIMPPIRRIEFPFD